MDKIVKFLKRLPRKDSLAIEAVFLDIVSGNTKNYNVKKLSGHSDIYKVRVRDIRIIYQSNQNIIRILDIGKRSEKTYKDY